MRSSVARMCRSSSTMRTVAMGATILDHLFGHVAGGEVPGADFSQGWMQPHAFRWLVLHLTTWVEGAPRGGRHRRGHITLEDDPLAAPLRVGHRNRRQERPGV